MPRVWRNSGLPWEIPVIEVPTKKYGAGGWGVVLQVRMGSSRLPGKALLPLAGLPVVLHAMKALAQLPLEHRVLACDVESREALEPWAREGGFQVHVGSAHDVLDRFYQAARGRGLQRILRATGDNPLVSATMANRALPPQNLTEADYLAFRGAPLGSGVEAFSFLALEQAWQNGHSSYEREHVTPYIYRNPLKFKVLTPLVPPNFLNPGARITLDIPQDYERLERIFAALYHGRTIGLGELCTWLKNQPEN